MVSRRPTGPIERGRQRRVVVAMAHPHRVGFARLPQLLQPVLAHRLQQSVTGTAGRALGDDKRLVHEQAQLIENLIPLGHIRRRYRPGGPQIEATEEYRQPAEQHALGLAQEGVRPIHGRAQRLLPPHRRPGTSGEQPEAIVEAVQDLGQRQRAQPGRRELDRQRHTVEPLTDLGDGDGVVLGDGEVGAREPSPVGEQLDSLVGERQGRHLPHRFPGDTERLPARGQHGDSRCRPEQRRHERGARAEDVLAVVEHHEESAVADEPQQGVRRGAARFVGQPEHAGRGDGHGVGVGHRSQVDEPDAVVVVADHAGSDMDRQPRLARAAGSAEGDEPVRGQGVTQIRRLGLAPDEGRQLGGQSVRDDGARRPQRREVVAQIRVTQLPDAFRPREIAHHVRAEVGQRRTVRELILGQRRRHSRQQRLAAVPEIPESRGAVDGRADVVAGVAQADLAGVDSDAQPDRCQRRALQIQRARHRVRRTTEGDDEAVALPLLDRPDPGVGDECGGDGLIETRDGGGHLVGLGLPEPRRAFDVSQQ